MQVVFHLGAHSTDEERLIRGLLRARDDLTPRGIIVPGPGRYRPVLRETLVKLRGQPASREVQEVILDAVMDEDRADRLIFGHEFFLCIPHKVVSDGGFYPMAGRKAAALASIFPEAGTEFFLALRDPATLIPALLSRVDGLGYDGFMGGVDPRALRWGPVVRQIREAAPDCPLTVWCNEDTPLIWPEVLRAVAGVGAEVPLEADTDVLATIMTEDGMNRLAAYLAGHPPATVALRRKIVSAFLDKFARPEELEMEVALPGWTDALVAEISAGYDADVAEIAAMPGVRFLSP